MIMDSSIIHFIHNTASQTGWTCRSATCDSLVHLALFAGPLEVFTVSLTDEGYVYNRPYHEYKKFKNSVTLIQHIESSLENLKHQYQPLLQVKANDALWIAIDKLTTIIATKVYL